jgi:hypothetical protein
MSRARDNADLGDSYGSLAVGVTGGSGLNALSASNLSAGTVPDARFPATLPAASGTNLTALPAANLSGTITSGTQDAITRLGTVASGNLSNTAIVYPAGHFLQIAQSATVTTSITTTATSTAAGDTNVLDATITTRQLNSKLLCQGVMLSHLNPNNSNQGVSGELWRVYDAGTDTSIRTISVSYIHEYSATYYHESYRTSWMYMYSPNVAAGTAVKLGIKIRADPSNGAGVAGYWHYSIGTTDAFFTITEVAV